MILEILAVIIVVLFLIYLVLFSSKFDRAVKRLFNRQSDSADGIQASVESIELQKVQTTQAVADRTKYLASEKAKLDSINIK